MSEQLFIRLGTKAEQSCHWLVYSHTHADVIASGVIPSALDLNQLQEHTQGRHVTVLVSASALHLTSVELPEKGQRQALKAVPYLLEEQLTDNIDNLHFVIGPKQDTEVEIAVIADEQMQQWLTWIENAGIKTKQMIPDCLAIPRTEHDWSALQLDDQWLIRTGLYRGMTVDADWLPLIAERTNASHDVQAAPLPEVSTFTPADESFPWSFQEKKLEQPMLVLARGAQQVGMNLLTGIYKPKNEYGKHIEMLRQPLMGFLIFLSISMLSKGVHIWQYKDEIAFIKDQMVYIHQTIKPNSKLNVNLVKKDLLKELDELEGTDSGQMFFSMLDTIQDALHDIHQIKTEALKFDASRQQFEVHLAATDYESVEKFEKVLGKKLNVQSGAMSNEGGIIQGKLVIKEL